MTSNTAATRKESARTMYAIKEGWISKKGSKAFHSFRDRYMILWSNKHLEYYTNESLEQQKGSIDLKGLHRRFIQRSDKVSKIKNKSKNKSKNKNKQTMYGFKIITTKRTWYLCVNDPNLRDEWIQTIRNVIDNILPHNDTINNESKTNTLKTNLLKSKISKIKLENTAKWNQLLIVSQQKQTNNYNKYINNRDEISNEIPNVIYSDSDNNEPGENINKINQTDEQQTNYLCVGEFKLYHNNNEEGSSLGLSLSTTPILNPPNSPNIIKQTESGNSSYSQSYSQFTDFWDLESAQNNKYIELSDHVLNAIHCSKNKSTQWMSCFGSKIVENAQSNIWKIKILMRDNNNNNNNNIANIMIGICDIDIIKNKNIQYGGFWIHPCFGYGYAGISGNKFDGNNKSEIYGCKYKINDIITMDLTDNKLMFSCNNINNGIAFNIDNKRKYVLAVAFCNNHYDIQIYD